MRNYSRQIVTILFLLTFAGSLYCEKIPVLKPKVGEILDFSPHRVKVFNSREYLDKYNVIADRLKKEGRSWDKLTGKEKEIINNVNHIKEGIWDVQGSPCGWLCGNGPKKVSASSHLKSIGKYSYKARNAYDDRYDKVWAEGVKGYGIGEYLLYTFSGECAPITKIFVVNGHVKSQSAWEKNSRVKRLKMYVNNKPRAILELKDVRADQEFVLPKCVGNDDYFTGSSSIKKPEWTLKFEILEVYKGTKYDDTVIAEICFDGYGHCFAAGTTVIMADGSKRKIESLKKGEKVKVYNSETGKFYSAEILKMAAVKHGNLVKYSFDNGRSVIGTVDHPFMLKDKGWSSLKPVASAIYKGFEKVSKIAVGDEFYFSDKNCLSSTKLVRIEKLKGEQMTYTICELNKGNNFIANGLIVGAEKLK